MGAAPTHRFVDVNGLRLHIVEHGQGPLVVLLHGWPESWYSWRHQFEPLAAAGYRVIAFDQRGYARSEQPRDIGAYTLLHLVGDAISLIEKLGYDRAVVVGHDWGAPVAWTAAMMRPDRVRAVAGLSIPPILPSGMLPPSVTARLYGDRFYQVYFQQPGVADAEFAADPPNSFRRILVGASGDSPHFVRPEPLLVPDPSRGLLDAMPHPTSLPPWLTEDDIRAYVGDYAPHGESAFSGGFNWYRNLERNNELLAVFRGRTIDVPALYVVGDRDMATSLRDESGRTVADMLSDASGDRNPLASVAPLMRAPVVLRGAGHWTQQERPEDVNAALLEFLAELRD
ncbi:alpha/beta fold hydrolase [Microbacterium karelineae]|uniref:alpha/beta fold hydrolase n=1 Tax=Microbacterium karelineae TaxID=2654283 RepID=UPI0012EAC715|nr:alpha/beta hydrolase [Microbacterium karelineae]